MKINTRNKETRFMNGNIDIDGEILDILIEEYGQKDVLFSDFDTDNAIYSDGFISAIEEGLIPELELFESHKAKYDKEYHHVIINDDCYVVYFN
jgi:hypothetical protein